MPRRSFLSGVGEAKQAALLFNLKVERASRELTQRQAADLLFVTQPTIAEWEKTGGVPAIYREYWRMYWDKHTKTRHKRTLKTTKEVAARTARKAAHLLPPELDDRED